MTKLIIFCLFVYGFNLIKKRFYFKEKDIILTLDNKARWLMYASLNLFTKEFTILPYEAPTMKELIDKMEKLKLDWYFWKVKKQNFYPSLRNVIKIEDGSETFPWTPNYPVTEKDRLVDFDKSSDDYNILYFVDI